eukprot:m.87002 g.87002  ORF g.87002 m.87002 type:complete len:1026 (-) comp14487_c0_seq6:60-3137(-)
MATCFEGTRLAVNGGESNSGTNSSSSSNNNSEHDYHSNGNSHPMTEGKRRQQLLFQHSKEGSEGEKQMEELQQQSPSQLRNQSSEYSPTEHSDASSIRFTSHDDQASSFDSLGEYDDDEDRDRDRERRCEVKLRVERRLLEYILQAPRYTQNGVHLFDRIAKEYGIRGVTVDPNFKIGARSKKDPTVRVFGELDQKDAVEAAAATLADHFDSKTNRIVARVDIPAEKHYFVIGKKGQNVREAMNMSGCHIHFPETSRDTSSSSPSKNQVTITGLPEGVELARVKIRGLTPVILCIEVPSFVPREELRMTPKIQSVAELYSITIFFKQLAGRVFIMFKGPRDRGSVLEEAARRVLGSWNADTSLTSYTLQFDVSCVHHMNMIGRNGNLLKDLMNKTNTKITFLEPGRGSTVQVTGSPENAKKVMYQFQSELPLSISFDLDDQLTRRLLSLAETEHQSSLEKLLTSLVKPYNVSVSFRLMGSHLSISIKGREAYVTRLYQARRAILMLGDKQVQNYGYGDMDIDAEDMNLICDDPKFFTPFHGATFADLFGHSEEEELTHEYPGITHTYTHSPFPTDTLPHSGGLYQDPLVLPSPSLSAFSGMSPFAQAQQALSTEAPSLFQFPGHTPTLPPYADMMSYPSPKQLQFDSPEPEASAPMSQYDMTSSMASPLLTQTQLSQPPLEPPSSEPYQHPLRQSQQQQHQHQQHQQQPSSTSQQQPHQQQGLGLAQDMAWSLPDIANELARESWYSLQNEPSGNFFFSQSASVPASPRRTLSTGHNGAPLSARTFADDTALINSVDGSGRPRLQGVDYETRRRLAEKAMSDREPKPVRVPTDFFVGDGFSRSMPTSEIKRLQQQSSLDAQFECLPEDPTMSSLQASLNISTGSLSQITQLQTLPPLPERPLMSSSPVPSTASRDSPKMESSDEMKKYWNVRSLPELLAKLGLHAYDGVFANEEIDLALFLTLTEADLINLGVTTFGARRKMLLAINNLREMQQEDQSFLSNLYSLSTSLSVSPSSSMNQGQSRP